jgi:hypothetical protein
LLQSLVSVTEVDALVLLSRLREGEPPESILSIAANMQRHNGWQRLHESVLMPANCYSPATSVAASDARRPPSPMPLEQPGPARLVFEPKIDVVPRLPSLTPHWYVRSIPLHLLSRIAVPLKRYDRCP